MGAMGAIGACGRCRNNPAVVAARVVDIWIRSTMNTHLLICDWKCYFFSSTFTSFYRSIYNRAYPFANYRRKFVLFHMIFPFVFANKHEITILSTLVCYMSWNRKLNITIPILSLLIQFDKRYQRTPLKCFVHHSVLPGEMKSRHRENMRIDICR